MSEAPPRDPAPAPLPPPPEFLEAAQRLGVEFEPGDVDRLGRYLALLLDANKSFNLTAIIDPSEAWPRHILDSLTLLPLLAQLPPGAAVIDVGSGGGLPGVPLAITLPQLRFTLLEATGKKAAFLASAAAALGLSNTAILNTRAERAGQDPAHRERYAAATARAVGSINILAELTIPFLTPPEGEAPSGRALLIKGRKAPEELAEARQALYLLHAAAAGTIDTPTGKIVILEKTRRTPRQYPRREGEPARAPLG
jgi:16S rRNA (guanine527-N7)-methyltransferase